MKYFYDKYPGKILNTTIDRYVYVSVNVPFDRKIKVRYSKNEYVDHIQEIKHTRVKAVLKFLKMNLDNKSLEITSTADIPSRGTGLGSSSSFTVGLLHALHEHLGKKHTDRQLAEMACYVEIDILKEPIGKQDQYASAFGGINLTTFKKGGKVVVRNLPLSHVTIKELERHMLMIYTGVTRSASEILEEQKKNLSKKIPYLIKMGELAELGAKALVKSDLRRFAEILEEEWNVKKNIAPITNKYIEDMYKEAKSLGAWGGRVSGAGGGGFMALIVPPRKQKKIIERFKAVNVIKPRITEHGSQVICDERTWN